jgi:hypothetical protein
MTDAPYVDETCSKCGTKFEAHVHFVRCDASPCPMKSSDPRSFLERLLLDDVVPLQHGESK